MSINKKKFVIVKVLFLCVAIMLLQSCRLNDPRKELIDWTILKVGINCEGDLYQGAEAHGNNEIVNSVSKKFGVVVETFLFNSENETIDSLNNEKIDIALNIIEREELYKNLNVSYVYQNRNLYCVTTRADYVGDLKLINFNKVIISNKLSDDSKTLLSNYSRKNNPYPEIVENTALVPQLLDEKGLFQYYFCYLNEAVSLCESNDFYMHKIDNVLVDNLVIVSRKKNRKLISAVNDVIINEVGVVSNG